MNRLRRSTLLFGAAMSSCLPACGLLSIPSAPADIDPAFNTGDVPTPIMTEGEPGFIDEPLFTSVADKIGHHAATITELSDGELLAAWYSYDGPHELDGSAIYMARRPTADVPWSDPFLHIDREQGDGNPVLYSEGNRVWLFQAVVPQRWSTAHIEMQQSNDNGTSWSAPTIIAGPIGANVRFPPIRLTDGTYLLPAYNDLLLHSLFYTSSDGINWQWRSTLATPQQQAAIQPSVAELNNGDLIAVMRNVGKGELWAARSADKGDAWSPAAPAGFANPDSPAAILRLHSGNLLLVYNDSDTDRRPLVAALSADEGQTWPARRVIIDGDATYSYPTVMQTTAGAIHVVYSFNRDHIRHATFNEAWIAEDMN